MKDPNEAPHPFSFQMQGCEMKIKHIRNACLKIKNVLHIMLLNPKISFNRRKETKQNPHILYWMLWPILIFAVSGMEKPTGRIPSVPI